MKKILVTGGAGFIGSHLVDRLIEEGYTVMVLDNLSRGSLENINAKADFEKIDVTSKKFLELMKKITPDIIFHLAAQSDIGQSLKNSRKDIAVNFLATQTLLEQAKVLKIKKIIFASSAAVYAESKKLPVDEENIKEPISLYGASKLLSEYLLQNYHKIRGLPYTSLRFANVYGPRQNPAGDYACLIPKFIKIIENGDSPAINGSGDQTRDFVYVQDVVNANILASNLPKESLQGGAVNIGFGQGYSVNEVTERLIRLCGKEIKLLHGPPVVEPKDTLADIRKAESLLKWKPATSFDEGLKATYNFFSTN